MVQITIGYCDSRGMHSYHFNVAVIPRIGEFVKLNGDWYKVKAVAHELTGQHVALSVSYVGRTEYDKYFD